MSGLSFTLSTDIDKFQDISPEFSQSVFSERTNEHELKGSHPPEAVGTSLELMVCLFVVAVG